MRRTIIQPGLIRRAQDHACWQLLTRVEACSARSIRNRRVVSFGSSRTGVLTISRYFDVEDPGVPSIEIAKKRRGREVDVTNWGQS